MKKPRAKGPETIPVRITKEAYQKVKKLKPKKETFSTFINKMVKAAEELHGAPEIYLVKDKAFTDIREARGEAILKAIEENAIPEAPGIALIVGRDSLV